MDIGHRLWASAPNPPEGEASRVGVAIVGAGPSGLSAAWRLERLGIRDYLVFDLEDKPGGTSMSGDDGVVPYPWGAHYIPAPSPSNPALLALLNETGIERLGDEDELDEDQLIRAPEERLFYRGRWYEGLYPQAGASRDDLSQLARFHREVNAFIGFRDEEERRAFTLPMTKGSDDAELRALDRISMETWLDQKQLTSPRLRWFVDYACRDDYGLSAKDTSAWAALFYFAARTENPGEDSAEFYSWPAGNGYLVDHLSRVAKGRVRNRALVTEIIPNEDNVELIVYDANRDRLERFLADYVIFACPKFLARHIIRPYRDNPPAYLDSFDYGAWMVANIHLRGRPASRGLPMAWDNIIYDSPSLGYVVATHQALIDYGPTIWTYYLPLTEENSRLGREKLLAPSHAEWVDAILADLGRAHIGLEGYIDKIDVWRWGHAMIRPKPGFIWGGSREKAAEPLGRIHFAHSDLSGLALFEEAQYRGIVAAEEIARRLGWQGEGYG